MSQGLVPIRLLVNDDAIFADSVAPNVVVVIYLTDDDAPGCDAVNGCLINIAKDYDHIKFCRMKVAAVAGCLSSKFKDKGVPAILAYKGGEQVKPI